jgi:chondroitin synthase
MTPKVSIIIPAYNSEEWIEECVMSALNQDYPDVEVIVVDNESTDRTVELLENIKSSHPQLILSSAENIYPNCWDEARAEGYRLMTGDYFTVIGSDDCIAPKFVSNCLNICLRAPNTIKAIQSPAMGFRMNGDDRIETGLLKNVYKNISDFKNQCLERCPVNSPTVFYNSSLLKDGLLETFPEKYGGAADYDLYCRLADNDVFIYPVPVFLGFYYRWHPKQATWKVHKEGVNYDKMIQDYWREKWT